MISSRFVICFLSLIFISASAQTEKDSLDMKLTILFHNQPLVLDKKYVSEKDTLQITMIKFYLSNVELIYTDGTSYAEKNSYHLIDASDKNSTHIKLFNQKNKSLSKVRFTIGVDSLASTTGALSGDLDPSKGMYWAWQSGYINMKIEGKSNLCPTRKSQFHFHLGGYLKPYYALRTVEIPIKEQLFDANQLQLIMDLSSFFETIDLKQTNSVMSPSKKTMELADVTALLFRIE